ncbi:hypothetical protein [Arenimonas sp.]|uniref:hypothetical protein n=1 Tax=Arenimonas sp. TaxID=1872635 RepID=UPI0025DBDE0C|nr:hypothetical protein [Arenimonas sp.]
MRASPLLILALATATLASPAAANVYKCTINGEVRYQDGPCPGSDGQKPHVEIKRDPVPAPQPAADAPGIAPAAPAQAPEEGSAASSVAPADPQAGTMGGEATPAQLRAAFEARAAAREAAPVPPPAADGPPDRLNELQALITQAQLAHRQLVSEQNEALLKLREQFQGREDSEEAVAAIRGAEFDWRQRRLQAADRERSLQAEISRLCPNGVLSTRGRLECR